MAYSVCMYGKIFASLYQGTLRGRAHEILVFTNLIATCSPDGTVDKHWKAISEEVGISTDEVKKAIENLEAPDPESRSQEYNGARLIRISEDRSWGWVIVNYAKYRAIRNEEDRKVQNRLAQERFRNKNKPPSARVSQSKPPSAQAEAEAEAEAEAVPKNTPSHPSPSKTNCVCVLKEKLNGMFNRKETDRWAYDEETGLVEVARRPECLSEFEELEKFRHSAGRFFPHSVSSLLSTWTKTLDSARNQPIQTNSLPALPASLMDLKTILSAKEAQATEIKNKRSYEVATGLQWENPQAKESWQTLRREIKELNNRIANFKV